MNIKIDGNSAARIIVNIEGQDKLALIDTGAGRCCMNKETISNFGKSTFRTYGYGVPVANCFWGPNARDGFPYVQPTDRGETYKQQFIVCRQLTPVIILGCNFLSCNRLGITWGPEGVLQLRDKQDLSIHMTEEITNPTVKLAVLVTVSTTLPSCKNKTCFDFIPMQTNPHLGPNCVVYPLDYASIKGGSQRGLQVLINLGQQDMKLQQGIVLGHFQEAQPQEIMITQEDIFEVNVEEPWAPGEIEEEVLKGDRKGFITSPTDTDPR